MPTLKEICDAVGGVLRGDGKIEITGVSSLDCAGDGDLAPLDNKNYVTRARQSKATAFVIATDLAETLEGTALIHDHPMVVMNEVIETLALAPRRQTGRHDSALIDETATVPDSVSLGANAIVGPGVTLGERCVVGPNVHIERGVQVGADTVLETGCILHEGAVIGARCTIGVYAVISRQGFGFAKGPRGPVRLIHVGKTVLGDDVHVGAHCCIDRARYDDTSLGDMSALDNHVHIGHNCRIGARTFVAAQTGMAGHAVIGNDVEIGGQVGIGNEAKVGDGARVGAQAGIITGPGVPPGEVWWGTPGKTLRKALRMEATLRRLAKI